MADVDFMLRLMSEHQDNPPEPTSDMVAKRELAVQLRRLNNLLCATQAPEDHIRELAGILEGHASLLEDALPEPEALGEDVKVISPQMEDFTDRSPFVGLANPISPPATLRFDLDDRCVRGEVTFRKSMEGAPGRVHGGMVAALLDEALGQACIFAGTPAMTAEFTARFLKATPVETPLRVEARVDGVDGRKIRASGAVFHGDESVVEADGLFIAVDTEKFQALFALLAETEQ